MSKCYYCPKCKKEIKDMSNCYPPINTKTTTNLRDGYGRIIKHYKCECGNYLAGVVEVKDNDEWDYMKEIIREYNPGGTFYTDELLAHAVEAHKHWSKQ